MVCLLYFRECIWDHAAGDIIVKEAGGHVVDFNNKPLDYSQGFNQITLLYFFAFCI